MAYTAIKASHGIPNRLQRKMPSLPYGLAISSSAPTPALARYAHAQGWRRLRTNPTSAPTTNTIRPSARVYELIPTIGARVRPGAAGVWGGAKFDRSPRRDRET